MVSARARHGKYCVAGLTNQGGVVIKTGEHVAGQRSLREGARTEEDGSHCD